MNQRQKKQKEIRAVGRYVEKLVQAGAVNERHED